MKLRKIKRADNPIAALLPNGNIINSSHARLCPGLKELPEKARTAHAFPNLKSGALISVPQLCDHDCTVVFHKEEASVICNNKIAMKAKRCKRIRLWCANEETAAEQQEQQPVNSLNNIIALPDKERTRFLHAALFSPPISTIRNALQNGCLKTWPHADAKHLNKNNENTLLGRLNTAKRKSKKTSVSNSKDKEEEEEEDIIQEEKTNLLIGKVIELDETTCSDQTGKFPCASSRGN